VKRLHGRVVINTGMWLKLQEKLPVILAKLPPVYYPLFRPNYFRILEDGELDIYYVTIEKVAPSELTLLQRHLTQSNAWNRRLRLFKNRLSAP
jgi:hypothetical protein